MKIKEEAFADKAWENFFRDMASFCLIVDGYGRFLDAAKEVFERAIDLLELEEEEKFLLR